MDISKKITSIRCPNERPHGKYNSCGRLLGAIDNKIIFVYCEECKQFFQVEVGENDTMVMTPIPKNTRLRLKTGLRMINDNRSI